MSVYSHLVGTFSPWPIAVLAALAGACDLDHYETPEDQFVPESTPCAFVCHGDLDSPAPPRDTTGNTDPSATGVGAHRVHLGASDWRKEIECSECHKVPALIEDEGHIDTPRPAELTFGPLSELTQWDGQTCSASYCHGSALTGGTAQEPVWTTVDGSQSKCDSCHGYPPPDPHPVDPDCGKCHQSMNRGDGMKIAYPELHINGRLDVVGGADCDSCHGSDGIAAPPQDTEGNTATTARGVGAHRQHVGTSGWYKAIECAECHVVPTAIADLGHTDTPLPAELTFGALAGAAQWDGTSCADSYCHGVTLTGGAAVVPEWTVVDGTQAECDSCHGAPPPAPHPPGNDCGNCHPTMTPGGGLEIAYPALHIDGNLDVSDDQPCDSCHGSGGISAPPADTLGNTDTTARGVGAHRSHLGISSWRAEIACEQCHEVPTSVSSVGHTDTELPAELTFGPMAGAAAWDGFACSDAYCHGATLTGGLRPTPNWTQVDGSQSQCDSCHGAPPPAPHPDNPDCGVCHDTMTPGEGLIISDPARHIDGSVQVVDDAACDSCHGSGGVAAPPVDMLGNTGTLARGVGAHRSHLGASDWHKEMQCSECHRVPASVISVGHTDTPLPSELSFGPLAGAGTDWNGATCSGSYCHGATLTGGLLTEPMWTEVDGSQAACGSCHGLPPPAPHPPGTDCGSCHPTMTPGGGLDITDPSRHIDGNVDVDGDLACDSCHGGGGNSAPPVDSLGNTGTTNRGVGAHRSHLGGSGWHKEIQCAECHKVPGTVGSVGHNDTPLPAELSFGPLAGSPTWNGTTCSNAYCHGATMDGGTATSPVWTTVDGSQSLCGSCHGRPPPPPHPAGTACEDCHGEVVGPGQVITTPSKHIDGILQVTSVHPADWVEPTPKHGDDFNQNGPAGCATGGCHGITLDGGASGVSCDDCHSGWKTSCDFCHGGDDNTTGAPPAAVGGGTARSLLSVGAHTDHVEARPTHGAWTCGECHTDPSSALSPGHVDGDGGRAEVVFSSLNPAANYDGGGTCSSLYCHGDGRGNNGSEGWTGNPTLACDSCHPDDGNGMSGKHKKHVVDKNIDCYECHLTVVNASMDIIAPSLHVNGINEMVMEEGGAWDPSTQRCSGLPGGPCHGTEKW